MFSEYRGGEIVEEGYVRPQYWNKYCTRYLVLMANDVCFHTVVSYIVSVYIYTSKRTRHADADTDADAHCTRIRIRIRIDSTSTRYR